MSRKTTLLAASLLLAGTLCAGTSMAQEQELFIYGTYSECDLTQQDRADQIVGTLDKPVYDAAVKDGTISGWGWYAHHTGGHWRRLQFHTASTMDALFAGQKKIGDQIEAKDKKMSQESAKICNSHDDYIWRRVTGSTGSVGGGAAAFSVYYVCDATREGQADALVKRVIAPVYDKLVAEGKLTSWGWNAHVVGGKYRRLATMRAADIPAVMAARGSIIQAFEDEPLLDTFTAICGEHTDYIWDVKQSSP